MTRVIHADSRPRSSSAWDAYDFLLAALIALSMAVSVVGFRYYLQETTTQFGQSFQAQNFAELGSGDILALSSRLNAVTTSLNWVCISARQSQHVFFERRRGSCDSSFFRQNIHIALPHDDNIRLDFTLRLPRALELALAALLCFQALSLSLIYWGSRKAEGFRHQGEIRLARLSAQVAHDIRSPLAALDSVLADLSQLPEERRTLIRDAVGRIKDIVSGLLVRSRAEPDRLAPSEVGRLPEESRSLACMVESVVSEKRIEFHAKNDFRIHAGLDESSYDMFIRVPQSGFKRVLSNLINNAIEALGEKGSVSVRTSIDGDNIRVSVQDDGKGISPEVLHRLGHRGATFGKEGGSGLGLYHARTSVESWGGQLGLASEAGNGTTVTLTLPRAEPPRWFVPQVEVAPGRDVVVLDDDPSVHMVWQGRLNPHGSQEGAVQVRHFSKPAELRSWVKEQPEAARQALYLLDYELTGYRETGLSLADELGIGAQSILVSGRAEEKEILDECLRLGIRALPKGLAPFVPIRRVESAAVLATAPGIVLLDDDALVHMTWKVAAQQKGVKLTAFRTPTELSAALERLPKETVFYLDSDLGEGVQGETLAKELHSKGYTNLYLATGHSPESLPPMPWIKQVVGKEPPWG